MSRGFSLQEVVELPEFIRQSEKCMTDEVRESFINFIAENPLKGEVIVGTGGARKIRWAPDEHQGKRGGVRVIYYYHDQGMPIFLFTVYKKNEKANLTKSEKNQLHKLIKQIISAHEEDKNE